MPAKARRHRYRWSYGFGKRPPTKKHIYSKPVGPPTINLYIHIHMYIIMREEASETTSVLPQPTSLAGPRGPRRSPAVAASKVDPAGFPGSKGCL